MNPLNGLEVDHIDGDGLNNQRFNLRICTKEQNRCNRKPNGDKKYIGVCGLNNGKFIAHIRHNKKLYHLGVFKTESDAAKAYNKAAIKYHREFANLNIIKTI
jgi:hypothetical protein